MSGVDARPRQVVIRTEQRACNQVRLSVRDAGTGFDPGEANRLFDVFFTTKGSGMGIGLPISRSIIESHGGRLTAELNDGPGATFYFSLSRMTDKAEPDPAGCSRSSH
jgi:signal transduction histidine kinase